MSNQPLTAAEWSARRQADNATLRTPDPDRIEPFDPDAKGQGYQYMRLAEYLARCIETQVITPKSALAPQRTLAGQYGVSLDTVRRAVAELEQRGLVKTLPHKGMFVL